MKNLLFFLDFSGKVSDVLTSAFFVSFPSFGPTKYSSREIFSTFAADSSLRG